MSGRISATRAKALRAAQQAKARRDADRLRREKAVESALADFYEETAHAEHIRAVAMDRAQKLLADAEAAAAAPEERARAAVPALHELGETREQIGELTGLALTDIRGMLATRRSEESAAIESSADRTPASEERKENSGPRAAKAAAEVSPA